MTKPIATDVKLIWHSSSNIDDHVDAIARLFVTSFAEPHFGDHWSVAEATRLIAEFANVGYSFLLAFDEQPSIVGFLAGNALSHELRDSAFDFLPPQKKYFFLHKMAVSRDFRRLGIASRLVSEGVAFAHGRGFDAALIRIHRDFEPTRRIVTRLGFESIRETQTVGHNRVIPTTVWVRHVRSRFETGTPNGVERPSR